MPLREYLCKDCNKHTESLLRTIEDILVRCPECGSENIEQLITAFGGYRGDMGGGSTPKRPNRRGSRR